MPWSKAQRREAGRSAQRSINAIVAERATRYRALFSKNIKRTPQSWSPTPLSTDAASLPVTPPPIPLVTTIYPVPVQTRISSQTTGDDMTILTGNENHTDKNPITQEQPIDETTKQPDSKETSIENIVAAAVIAYKNTHGRRNPPYIEISAFAQTILEIRGYASEGHILKTRNGDPSNIQIRIKKLNADQVICGETEDRSS